MRPGRHFFARLAGVFEWLAGEPRLHHVRPRPGTTTLIRYAYSVPSVELCKAMFDESGAFAVPGAAFDEEYSVRPGCACARDILEVGLAAISANLRTLEGCLGRRG